MYYESEKGEHTAALRIVSEYTLGAQRIKIEPKPDRRR